MNCRVAATLCAAAFLAGCASDKPAPVAREPAPPPAAAQVCIDFSFPIYFETSSDRLNGSALSVITDAAQRVRGCALGRIDVVGLADADGAANRNLALSRRRATSVAAALAAAGLPRPTFDIDAMGEAGALTAEGAPEPLRRRADVVIHASPRPPPVTPSPARP